ncbi:helix-turn-helix transcriptional regulator [Polynucleobacter paneuropaeus]|nr:helix-turn-helix transcriptional regulator [Polynucleobacter paneuropaeus]MBT8530974.1 helix-turn-helix transcriptional regulator [Polynucleobacter paneuropaeus]MBT8602469.1 helix-turn-helix transcriptional regulator [Polynucleobacter paneuropaeus]MBT8624422.1 helix-turn-helix transcriptional regulator [Polynucleobacter paneuropaeus]MBT8628693.1 helix-turn-helix transcriptional regulator [Polynucleobacter paneuropaeus]
MYLITSDQIRAARAMLRWSGKELASKSGVGFSTLMRLEVLEGTPGSHVKTLEAIKKAFESAGIEFIGTPEQGAGVRWK